MVMMVWSSLQEDEAETGFFRCFEILGWKHRKLLQIVKSSVAKYIIYKRGAEKRVIFFLLRILNFWESLALRPKLGKEVLGRMGASDGVPCPLVLLFRKEGLCSQSVCVCLGAPASCQYLGSFLGQSPQWERLHLEVTGKQMWRGLYS